VSLPCVLAESWKMLIASSTCTSSMYTMTYAQITEEFRCSDLVATLGLTTYVFGIVELPATSSIAANVSFLDSYSDT
jgi:hypothetical protein